MYRLGVDVGGTKVLIGFLDEQGAISYQKKYQIPEYAKKEHFVLWLYEILKEAVSEAEIHFHEIRFCGIGVPGTVSQDGKVVIKAPNLDWENVRIAEEFTKLTGIPAKLVQDSRAGAWGEYLAGGGKGYQNVICITLGTGIGTGIVLNGQIFDGSLSGAGEIGHVPVGNEGRACGCGQMDCLEKYVAGLGLDITAKKLFGEQSDTRDLFLRADRGEESAKEAIAQAVKMLGKTLVSAINLLSPDCLLFSGGLSRETKLYVEPLIAYIKQHSYALTGEKIHISLAALGETAPMVGAALLPQEKERHRPLISASIMCADLMNLGKALKELEDNRIDYIHYDMMDNHFVPNMMLCSEMLEKMRANTTLPFDIHIMAEHPEEMIGKLNLQANDYCAIHYESTNHLQRVLSLIRERGAKAAVALNPATPVEVIREIVDDLDMVLIMTVNPGFSGQKLIAQTLPKIKRMRSLLDEWGHPEIRIEVDGNCSFENIPKMREQEADMFVVGTSSVFHPHSTIGEAMRKIQASLT